MKLYTQKQAAEAAAALKKHAILAFPTDTVYGVGVLSGSLGDLNRLKQAKHRPETKPIPVMAARADMLAPIAVVDERARKIMDAFLPGPLTLILPLKDDVDRRFTNGMDTVAVRIPDDAFVLAMIEQAGAPLFVTSANLSGEPTALTTEDVLRSLKDIDGIVEGTCAQLQASTIVDCTGEELRILRPGPVSLEELNAAL